MNIRTITTRVMLAGVLCAIAQNASADMITPVSFDTAPLVGHAAGPFSVLFVFTDGNGIGDANNTITVSDVIFGGGSPLGSPLVFGGAAGSLGAGLAITDSSFLSLFLQSFAPGMQLSFLLTLTTDADAGGTPDRLTASILDSSGVPLPTLAPFGDYFFGVDLGSSGPVFDRYASDPSRAPTVGSPVSMPAPTVGAVPEPSAIYLLGAAIIILVVKHRSAFSSML